jgi:hypothetical protein
MEVIDTNEYHQVLRTKYHAWKDGQEGMTAKMLGRGWGLSYSSLANVRQRHSTPGLACQKYG